MEFVAAQLQDTRDSSQCIAGSADELNCKDMLALNLRKLGEEVHHLAPRSYVILPQRECDGEFDAFVKDFMLSRALAILKFIAEPHGEQIEITAANDVEMRTTILMNQHAPLRTTRVHKGFLHQERNHNQLTRGQLKVIHPYRLFGGSRTLLGL